MTEDNWSQLIWATALVFICLILLKGCEIERKSSLEAALPKSMGVCECFDFMAPQPGRYMVCPKRVPEFLGEKKNEK